MTSTDNLSFSGPSMTFPHGIRVSTPIAATNARFRNNKSFDKSRPIFAAAALLCFATLTPADLIAQDMIRPSASGLSRTGTQDQFLGLNRQSRLLDPGAVNQAPLGIGNEASSSQDSGEVLADAVREAGRGAMTPSGYVRDEPQEDYNFRVGPVFFRVGVGLRLEYNDNITNSSDDRQGDLVATPQIYLNGHWPISKINDLTLRLGVGYTAYLTHSELNSASQTLELAPGTQLAFKMKVGDLYFNFYERPSIGQDSLDLLTLPSGLLFTSFNNAAGVNVFWDLNDVSVQAGYQRTDTIPLDSQSISEDDEDSNTDFLRQSVDTLSATVTFRINEETSAGLEAAASKVTYREDFQNDGISYHGGVFFAKRLTHYLTFRVAGGVQQMTFDSGGGNEDSSDSLAPYGNFELQHRINRFLSHSFSAGYETVLGTTTNSVQTTSLSEQVTIEFARNLSLSLNAFYQAGDESGGPSAQSLQLFGFGLSCGYSLTTKLRMDLFYQFIKRTGGGDTEVVNSNELIQNAGDYYQNRVGVNFSYAF